MNPITVMLTYNIKLTGIKNSNITKKKYIYLYRGYHLWMCIYIFFFSFIWIITDSNLGLKNICIHMHIHYGWRM